MAVERTIPKSADPWVCTINGKKYSYAAGSTETVPDEVAAVIDGVENSEGKPDPRASQRGIEKDVTQIVKDNFAGGVGYEETSEVVMLPETSFEVSGTETGISESFPYTFEIGKEYVVTLDGVTNTYTAVDDGYGLLGITNTSADDVENGNGWMVYIDESELLFFTHDAAFSGAHTISISGATTEPHKIDSRYIPAVAKALYADKSSNLFTDFTDPDSYDPNNPPSVALTYAEAYYLFSSCIHIFIFDSGDKYTVLEIRPGLWDSANGTGFKDIYFDVMYGSSIKSYKVTNPDWMGVT